MALRVAVVGGGPAGSSAAETLVKAGIETYLFERKLDNAKPCGGAIPLCMVDEFDLPPEIIDRRVRKMKMISPSNIEVNIGSTLKDDEYIGMCRREVLDGFLRERAEKLGTKVINGTVHKLEIPSNDKDPYTLHYADHSNGTLKGDAKTLQVDMVIGADGANSRVARAIDAGD
ncbi:MAG: FAD-dependent monooxygenase, partial [Cyanobacteria bacterium P01_H01_bin.105]